MTPPVGHARSGRSALVSIVVPHDLVGAARALFSDGMRLALVSGHDDGGSLRATSLFTSGPPDTRIELHVPLDQTRPQVPTLAALSFPASRFERELADPFGIEPVGHPQARRLVLHQHWPEGWHPMRDGSGDPPEMVTGAESLPFVPVEGPGVYEIPVGPVHAGLIEPGHFRFWVVGETIQTSMTDVCGVSSRRSALAPSACIHRFEKGRRCHRSESFGRSNTGRCRPGPCSLPAYCFACSSLTRISR